MFDFSPARTPATPSPERVRTSGSCGNACSRPPTHDEVERRAYEIYVAHGRADGQSDDHWYQAEHQLAGADDSAAAQVAPHRQ